MLGPWCPSLFLHSFQRHKMTSTSARIRPLEMFSPDPAFGSNPFQARYTDTLIVFHHALQRASTLAAIHYFDQTISYAVLNRLSTPYALDMPHLGVEPGGRDIMDMQNS